MSLLVTEDATPKPATTVVPLVAWQGVTATRGIEVFTKLTVRIIPDTVVPVLATGLLVASTSFTTILLVVRIVSTLAPALRILTEAWYSVLPLGS